MLAADSTIFLSGATGTFGVAFLTYRQQHFPFLRVRAFSRDELKQSQLRQRFGDEHVSWLLGDVRDLERLRLAMRGVEYVIHAAALKQVPIGESNPDEVIKTNVYGSSNVVRAAIDCGVRHAVLLSSDKSCQPINLYGATKLCAERLFIQGNTYGVPQGATFSVVRYGNVMGSRGSVLQVFREAVERGKPLPLTHPDMTRFWIVPEEAVRLALFALGYGTAGTVLVPHLPAFGIKDLALSFLTRYACASTRLAVAGNLAVFEESSGLVAWQGIRPGEKLRERLLADDEYARARLLPHDRTGLLFDAYAVAPALRTWAEGRAFPEDWTLPYPTDHHGYIAYDSGTWPWRMGSQELWEQLKRVRG